MSVGCQQFVEILVLHCNTLRRILGKASGCGPSFTCPDLLSILCILHTRYNCTVVTLVRFTAAAITSDVLVAFDTVALNSSRNWSIV